MFVNKEFILAITYISLFSLSTSSLGCNLTVATPDIPPHFWIEHTQAKGLTVDFFNLVAKESGCRINYKDKPWKRVIHELKNGSVDMTIGFYYKKREAFARYSTTKFGQYQFFIFSLDPTNKLQTVRTLYADKKKLMYLKNWYLGSLKEKITLEPNLAMPILSLDKGLQLMVVNRAQAIIGPKVETLYSIKQNNLINKVFLSSGPLASFDQYVIFSKNSVSIATYNRINAAITAVLLTGKLADMAKKYTD